MTLKELKEKYSALSVKHKIPDFSELNKYFEIDRIDKDSEFLLRDIRKAIIERIIEFARLTEMLINPVNAPQMFLQFIKKINLEDKKLLEKVYEQFILLELESLACDIYFVAEKETSLINSAFNNWKSLHKDLLSVISLMGNNFKQAPHKREKSYLG